MFTMDDIKAHPDYVWVEGDEGLPSTDEEISEDDSEEEGARRRVPRGNGRSVRNDPRMWGVIVPAKLRAHKIWKKTRLGTVIIPKTGGRSTLAIIFADNSNSDAREIPPPEMIERLKEVMKTTRDPEWYQATSSSPIKHLNDPSLLVYGIMFTMDDIKAHPDYTWDEGDEGPPSTDEEISEDDSEEEGVRRRVPRGSSRSVRSDPRIWGVMISAQIRAHKIWKKSRMGTVIIPKTGGRSALSIIFADNSNLDSREIPPPEVIERLKEVVKTTRDPEWYQAKDP